MLAGYGAGVGDEVDVEVVKLGCVDPGFNKTGEEYILFREWIGLVVWFGPGFVLDQDLVFSLGILG